MKKKLLTLTLLSSFLLSATGMPLTVSFCGMNNHHSAGHCVSDIEKLNDHTCCTNDKNTDPLKIGEADSGSCCKLKIADNDISGKFISLPADPGSKNLVNKLIIIRIQEFESGSFSPFTYVSINISPPVPHNHIYLDNSILII